MTVAGIPVRVRPAFFVVAALMGAGRTTAVGLGSWIGASLVSVLFHEFGHATMGRLFGLAPSIELYERGGVTSFGATGRRLAAWKDILVCLAGPGAGFLLGGAIWAAARAFPPSGPGALVVRDMLWCNLGWGVANLLPILPLDGGQVAATLLNNERRARVLSLLAAAAAGAWALASGWAFGALYAAWFAAPNVSALQRMAKVEKARDLGPRLLRLAVAGKRDEAANEFETLKAVCEPAYLAGVSAELFHASEFALSERVSRHLFETTGVADAAYNVACALARTGRIDEGIEWLEKAAAAGYHDAPHLAADEDLAGLRAHPRFAEILERLRIAPASTR